MEDAAPSSFRIAPIAVPTLNAPTAGAELPLRRLRDGLDAGAAQAIYLPLRNIDPAVRGLLPLLSPAERARAERVSDRQVALGFVLGRWLVRSVLGTALGISPEAVPLVEGAHGKPLLESGTTGDLAFNLAHSGALAVLAVAAGAAIGVDLECLRPLNDAQRLARRILTPREMRRYRGLAEHEREAVLFAAWVRKEAVLKASGAGVSGSPACIETALDPAATALHVLGASRGPVTWFLHPLKLPPNYVGALVLDRPRPSLLSWQARSVRD